MASAAESSVWCLNKYSTGNEEEEEEEEEEKSPDKNVVFENGNHRDMFTMDPYWNCIVFLLSS